MEQLLVAEVVLENALPAFDKAFHYLVPPSIEADFLVGARVRVPFGRSNAERTGFVLSLLHLPLAETKRLKKILLRLDSSPLINAEGIHIVRYLKEFTFCTWFDAVRLLIPTGLGITPTFSYESGAPATEPLSERQREILHYLAARRSGQKSVKEAAFQKALSLETADSDLQWLLDKGYVLQTEEYNHRIQDDRVLMVRPLDTGETFALTKRQQEVLDFLWENPEVSVREACYYAGTSRSVIEKLEQRNLVELFELVRSRGGFDSAVEQEEAPPVLSEQQEVAYQAISALRHSEPSPTVLLYGVTGSGKTEVFLKVIADVVAEEKGVIVMVPEISLTSQTIRSLQGRFGNLVAVLHSGLSLGERRDEWLRIQSGKASIVVGTRSAVFAPLPTLGLIVMDEEQEHTYKSERAPRFHARDVARLRANYHSSTLLLSSATPAVESYYLVLEGKYHLVTLPDRFGKNALPAVEILNMLAPENLSASLSLSQVLLEELRYNLDHAEQSILLLNRRGYSTLVNCTVCTSPVECPHCSIAMTYHTANNQMVCHYCGFSQKKLDTCTKCGSELIRYSGIGTQQLEEELQSLFPEARLLRMDRDTTLSRHAHETMFDAFRREEYDIMIGTQMVAKGLNFPKVTLVGVLNADQSLYSEDFRSYERTFSLLTQVVGRSGRGVHPGRAFIQTWTPEHSVIHDATAQDYPAFYREEINARRLTLYPPFCSLMGIGFVGEKLAQVEHAATMFSAEFQARALADYSHLPFRVLGPSPGEILKIAGKYRYKLIVKCRNSKSTREFVASMLQWYYENNREVSVFIDMYYERL